MGNGIVNDLDIQALADGELDGDEERRVRAALQSSPLLKSRYDQLVRQRRLIAAAWLEEDSGSVH